MSPNPSYISIATTAKRLNKSIRTIWRWTNQKKAEGFPQPIKLSAGTTVLDFEDGFFSLFPLAFRKFP